MAKPSPQDTIMALLQTHGRTFARELEIPVETNHPDALFSLLCASLLFSIRINHKIAIKAARALFAHGWSSPQKLAASTWEQRVKALDEVSYVRYDESMSRKLGDMARAVIDRYKGDLRRLRSSARNNAASERALLEEFKGIGDVGADIFFREVQVVWDEVFPFADAKALAAAKTLHLPHDTAALLKLVGPRDFPKLIAALVRVSLEGDHLNVLRLAREIADQMVSV